MCVYISININLFQILQQQITFLVSNYTVQILGRQRKEEQ